MRSIGLCLCLSLVLGCTRQNEDGLPGISTEELGRVLGDKIFVHWTDGGDGYGWGHFVYSPHIDSVAKAWGLSRTENIDVEMLQSIRVPRDSSVSWYSVDFVDDSCSRVTQSLSGGACQMVVYDSVLELWRGNASKCTNVSLVKKEGQAYFFFRTESGCVMD